MSQTMVIFLGNDPGSKQKLDFVVLLDAFHYAQVLTKKFIRIVHTNL